MTSTAPVAATAAARDEDHDASASSLKRRFGYRARRRPIAPCSGGSPSPSELTKRTGAGTRPSASGRPRPACASARSRAADSKAHRRQRRAISHAGGSVHRSRAARCSQKVAQRPAARQREGRRGGEERPVVVEHVPADVLAEPFGAIAVQPHEVARALLGGLRLQWVRSVRLDDEREVGDAAPQGLGHVPQTMPNGGMHRLLPGVLAVTSASRGWSVDQATTTTGGTTMLEKVFYTSVMVSNQDRALDFYTNVLGLEKRVENPTPDGPVFLTVGVKGDDFQLVLWPGTPGNAQPVMGRPPASVTIETDDCRKTSEELKARGVKFVSDVLEFPWGYVAQFEDPDGNLLQVRQGR